MQRHVVFGLAFLLLASALSSPVLAGDRQQICEPPDPRYAAPGPWNIDLGAGAMIAGGPAQGTLELFVTRTLWSHLKLGGGAGFRLSPDLYGFFPQLLIGLRFPFGSRVALDVDWRAGYGVYHIDSAAILPLWRDAVVLAPSISGRLALSRRLELWVTPFSVKVMISGHNGYVASHLAASAGASLRF